MAPLSRVIRSAPRLVARSAHARRLFATTPLRSSSGNDINSNNNVSELGVGELQGAQFKIEPLRRVGEDDATKRARLLCMPLPFQSVHAYYGLHPVVPSGLMPGYQ
jgi:hypothetical protein